MKPTEQAIETAARYACELLGQDPDHEVIRYVPEEQCEVRLKNWMLLAPKVREQWAILQAIARTERETLANP